MDGRSIEEQKDPRPHSVKGLTVVSKGSVVEWILRQPMVTLSHLRGGAGRVRYRLIDDLYQHVTVGIHLNKFPTPNRGRILKSKFQA